MDAGGDVDGRTGGSEVSYLDDHPIARRVVEQRMREAVYDWTATCHPDIVEGIRFTVLHVLDEADAKREALLMNEEEENVGER